jgi:hypothetical protein
VSGRAIQEMTSATKAIREPTSICDTPFRATDVRSYAQ